ncbi:MAG: PAS domain S-box protein [Burkholderiales bacterium]
MKPSPSAADNAPSLGASNGTGAATLAWVYASLSAVWILFSDKAVQWWVTDPDTAATLQTLKGWLFVAATSVLLYVLARRLLRGQASPAPRSAPSGAFPVAVPLLLIGVALTTLAVVGISTSVRSHRQAEIAQLRTTADLKTRQIAGWLDERYSDMHFIHSSRLLPQHYERWQHGRDKKTGTQLQERLAQWRQTKGYDDVAVHDADGQRVWHTAEASGDETATDPALAAAIREAVTSQRVMHAGPHHRAGQQATLDFIVPMPHSPAERAFAVVFHLDGTGPLQALLDGWLGQNDGADLMLCRLDGQEVVYLRSSSSPGNALPAAAAPRPGSVAVEVLNGRAAAGTVINGLDTRGRPVVALSHRVPGTDWLLVASIDEAALHATLLRDAGWIVLATLLVALIASGAVITLRQRQALAAARLQGQTQTEKLRLQAQLSRVAESVPGVLFSFQRDATRRHIRVLYASPASQEMMGLSVDDLMRDATLWFHLIHPDDVRAMVHDLDISAANLTPAMSEWRQTHPTKGERWLTSRSMPTREADGSTVWHGYVADVTAEKAVAQALQLSLEQLEDAQRAAHLGHYHLNAVTRLWTCSVSLGEVFGISSDDVHDEASWLALIHPEDRDGMAVYLRDHVMGKALPFDREYRICRASDGVVRWVHGLGRLRLDDNGRPLSLVGTLQDITERKLAEQQLRQLSLAVEQSPESIVISNLDGRMEYVNEAFVRISGYSRAELLGRRPTQLRATRDHRPQTLAMRETVLRGETWKGKFVNRRKDGSEYVEFAIVSPIRQPDGTITHYLAVKEDITEKQRLAEELDQHRHHLEDLVAARTAELALAREKAEAANRAKSTFLTNMSHEIRTPMNAIIGLSALLQRSDLAPQQAQRLHRIDVAAHHLLSMLNDVLDFSKIEAGQLELEQIDFSLDAVLDQVHSLIAQQAGEKGLVVEMQNQCPGLWLHGDPTRVRQALLNYASNAVKFTEQGIVRLHAQRLDAPADHDHDHETDPDVAMLHFEVEDTGSGVPPDRLGQLFEAFEQADASITRRHGGSGLGLSITRRLAELMGGTVGASSAPGQGSRFWFTARVQVAPMFHKAHIGNLGHAPANRLGSPLGVRILLVEDEPINREVARELLEGFGAEVVTATNGREAVEQASGQQHDLVLMDLQMPEMDGLQATRTLRQLPGWAGVPIIALTANAFVHDRAACLEAGMNDYLCKPVEADALRALLERWLPGIGDAAAPVDSATGAAASSSEPLPIAPQTLARLLALLEVGDIEANTLAEHEQAALSASLGSRAGRLFTLLKRYDFEGAATLLRTLQPAATPG